MSRKASFEQMAKEISAIREQLELTTYRLNQMAPVEQLLESLAECEDILKFIANAEPE